MQHSRPALPNSHALNSSPTNSKQLWWQTWRNFLKMLSARFAPSEADQPTKDSTTSHNLSDNQIDASQIYAQRLQDTWIYGHSHLVNDCKITKQSSPNLLIPDLKRLEGGWSHNGLHQWR